MIFMIDMKNCEFMENLLINEFISHYNLPSITINNWILKTSDKYFEIEDREGEIILHSARDNGVAKFTNHDALYLVILNYDKFITAISSDDFTTGRKRCDIILCSSSDSCFILGELKDRNTQGRKRAKVRKQSEVQLLESLKTLVAVPEIEEFMKQKKLRRCCYFNKQAQAPKPIGDVIRAFNRLPNNFPHGFKKDSRDIQSFDFEFYEYAGEQTMAL